MYANNPVIRTIRAGQFPGIHFEADGGEGGTPTTPEAFSDAQQAKVTDLINQAVARANKAAEKKQADANAEWEKRFKALEEAKPKTPPEDDKEKSIPISKLAELKKEWESELRPELDKRDATIKSLLDSKRQAEIISEAAKLNVVDPALIAKLVSDQIAFDDDGATVIRGADGKERFGKAGLMTVSEMLGDFLKDKPYFVKSQAQPGGGSGAPRVPGGKPDTKNMSHVDKIAAGLAAQTTARDEFAD
jgi:hypothetical protein